MKKGFTLVELLIVIVIIGVLVAVVSTNLVAARDRAKDAQKKTNLQQLKLALRLYYTDYGRFPADGSPVGFSFMACGATGSSTCAGSTSFSANNKEYMNKIPRNSGGQYDFNYYSCSNGDDFRLKVTLTNKSDPDIAESQLRCPACNTTYSNSDYVLCNN